MIKRLFIAAIIFGLVLVGCSDRAVETSATITIAAIASLVYLGFHAWRYGCKKTDERVARERAARGNRPGFFARIGRSLANASRPPANSRTCPTCGGLGANRHWDSKSQSSYTSECSLCAGKGYLYT